MKMPPLLLISLLVLFFLITGCDKKQEVEQAEEIRPVKTVLIEAPGAAGMRNFPGRVDANRKAELSFRVSGKVSEFLVNEGDLVTEGDVIARLDNADFQITVNDKQATFTRASNDFNRGKELIKDGNISKMDFDKLQSNYLSAKADLDLAKQQLTYTELKAPFTGTIARRYIENFEEVQAKQTIVTLNDNQVLEVRIDVPENLVLAIKRRENVESVAASTAKHRIPVYASFQTDRAKEYKLTFKEASTKADEKTQTFSVAYTMAKPVDLRLLPGMTASVRVDLTDYIDTEDSFYLPVSAVVANEALQGTVWIVNEQSMTVEPLKVKVGNMRGNQIQVVEGLHEGQRVVIAGVPFLYKGLKVTLMKQGEQARDNLQHEQPVMQPQQTLPKEG